MLRLGKNKANRRKNANNAADFLKRRDKRKKIRVVITMKQNDEIQRLFDDYADSLPIRQDLAQKAAVEAERRKKKPTFWRWFSPLAAALVLVVFCFAVFPSVFPNKDNPGNSASDKPSEGQNQTQILHYAVSDVVGKTLSAEEAQTTFKADELNSDVGQVIYQKYYVFYMRGTTDVAYYKACLGVMINGNLTEVYAIAENKNYRSDDLYRDFASFYSGEQTQYHFGYERGEWVTGACFVSRDFRYFVSTTGGNDDGMKIIEKLM